MPETLVVNEIYLSLQGESTFAGLPCVFIRLTACDLRCSYCDTAYAFAEGAKQSLEHIQAEVHRLAAAFANPVGQTSGLPVSGASGPAAQRLPLVELTGGEPLLQRGTLPLMAALCDAGRTVLIETSGSHDISQIDPRVHRIMDLKTPGSGQCARNLWSNVECLTPRDEVKFVIGSREDYEWSRAQVRKFDLTHRVKTVLFSPVFGQLKPVEIVDWILGDRLDVRFQLQLHKFIWDPKERGV